MNYSSPHFDFKILGSFQKGKTPIFFEGLMHCFMFSITLVIPSNCCTCSYFGHFKDAQCKDTLVHKSTFGSFNRVKVIFACHCFAIFQNILELGQSRRGGGQKLIKFLTSEQAKRKRVRGHRHVPFLFVLGVYMYPPPPSGTYMQVGVRGPFSCYDCTYLYEGLRDKISCLFFLSTSPSTVRLSSSN